MVDLPSRSLHPRAHASMGLQALYRKLPWTRRFQRIISALLVILLFYLTYILFKTQTDSSITHSTESHSFLRKAHVPGWDWKTSNRQAKHSQQDSANSDPTRPGKGEHHHPQHDPLVLTSAEELAAVVHFITALRSNAITDVDPDAPVPPELLLGFNIRAGEKSRAELDDIIQNTWFEHPVVIFSEGRAARSREVKNTFASYKLLPVPAVIEVNERDDAGTLEPIIYRLTNSTSLPVVLVGGKYIGTGSEVARLHEEGELKTMLEKAGAVINGSEKRKKRKLVQYNPEKK